MHVGVCPVCMASAGHFSGALCLRLLSIALFHAYMHHHFMRAELEVWSVRETLTYHHHVCSVVLLTTLPCCMQEIHVLGIGRGSLALLLAGHVDLIRSRKT